MTRLETFRLIAPEFSTITDTVVGEFFTLALLYLNLENYATASHDMAISLQAASLLYSQKLGGGGSSGSGSSTQPSGVLVMEKEGDLTRQYSTGGTTTSTTTRTGATKDIYKMQLDALPKINGTVIDPGGNVITAPAMITRFGLDYG